ncbi:MAG: biotin carboxylase N-terminal domain-containing protein, partial [Pseudomonadales bacterium]
MRTARRLGLRSIAVYSEADRHAQHVKLADEAHFLGPAPAAESYLNIEAVMAVAKATGAEAIHPGY